MSIKREGCVYPTVNKPHAAIWASLLLLVASPWHSPLSSLFCRRTSVRDVRLLSSGGILPADYHRTNLRHPIQQSGQQSGGRNIQNLHVSTYCAAHASQMPITVAIAQGSWWPSLPPRILRRDDISASTGFTMFC